MVFDYVGKDRRKIVTQEPGLAFFHDKDDLDKAREAAKDSKMGQIECIFRQVHVTQEAGAYGEFTKMEMVKPKGNEGEGGMSSCMGIGAGGKLDGAPAGPVVKTVLIKVRVINSAR